MDRIKHESAALHIADEKLASPTPQATLPHMHYAQRPMVLDGIDMSPDWRRKNYSKWKMEI